MISRVADGCFWLARYLERVDMQARLLDVRHALHIDAGLAAEWRWRPLVEFVGQESDFAERLGAEALDSGEAVQAYLTWDPEHPSSLYCAVRGARENARTVREIMSLEAWEAINDLWLWIGSREARQLYQRQRGAFYERLVKGTVLFHGVSYATLLHDEPFSFMKLGRAVERVGLTAGILDVHTRWGQPTGMEDAARWLAILRSCCAFDPFFRRCAQPLTGEAVTRFLLFDPTFPRSVLYNLDEARRLLYDLRREDPVGLPRRSRASLERLRGELMQMNMTDVQLRGLQATFRWIVGATDELCHTIHDDYLDPPMPWLRHSVRVLESLEAPPKAERAA